MKTTMDVLLEYMRERRIEGLSNPDTECGCTIEDFMPCCETCSSCFLARNDKKIAKEKNLDSWMIPLTKKELMKKELGFRLRRKHKTSCIDCPLSGNCPGFDLCPLLKKTISPRYDDVYFEGVRDLDKLK